MPGPCRIEIQGASAGPTYLPGGWPIQVSVTARCTDHCQQARVIVRDPALGSLVVADQTVAVDFSQAASAPDELKGVISLHFTLIPLSKRCGDQLQVQVTCSQDQACTATRTISIDCKPPPPNIGWNWCRLWILLATGILVPALILIAAGFGMQQSALILAALVMIGIAGGLWALWMIVCSPDICTRLGVLCWVFKRAFIGSLFVLPFSSNVAIVLILICYGSAAGSLVLALRSRSCPVPSARLSLTQLPI